MPVNLASELRSELKRYISSVDRNEAADTVVAILVDNDVDIEDIRSSFKGDPDIKRVLAQYTEDIDEDVDDDEVDG